MSTGALDGMGEGERGRERGAESPFASSLPLLMINREHEASAVMQHTGDHSNDK